MLERETQALANDTQGQPPLPVGLSRGHVDHPRARVQIVGLVIPDHGYQIRTILNQTQVAEVQKLRSPALQDVRLMSYERRDALG